MIKIAVAAALAAIVVTDTAFFTVSTSTPASATTERPRGLKGDRLPIRSQGSRCADAVWPNYPTECIGTHREPADYTPSTRVVRSV
ncbi:MAG: hypothetical protein K2Y27_10655 [Xanthobacteraceae bacterium]|nr:hypothetical protein [Xanthobacteraceae bacterium]